MQSKLVERPDVAELLFMGFDHPVHPEFLDPLESHRFEREGYTIHLHLTRSGHAFSWRRGKTVFVESMGCQSDPLPTDRQMFAHRVGSGRTEKFQVSPQLTYQTCFAFEELPPEIFYRQCEEIRYGAQHGGVLFETIPKCRLALAPFSFIDLQARPGSVILHSYHSFPEEYRLVKVQSLLEFR